MTEPWWLMPVVRRPTEGEWLAVCGADEAPWFVVYPVLGWTPGPVDALATALVCLSGVAGEVYAASADPLYWGLCPAGDLTERRRAELATYGVKRARAAA
jgi:hypothetical protein